MENVCGVVDIQGFNLSIGFIVREMAITSPILTQCLEVNPQLNWCDLNEEDMKTVNFTLHNINGLHLLPFNDKNFCFLPKNSDVETILKYWYRELKNNLPENKYLLAYKNCYLKNILDSCEIPSLNLDDFEFPSLKILDRKYGNHYLCGYHKKPPKGIRFTCAYRKSNILFREIIERIDEKV